MNQVILFSTLNYLILSNKCRAYPECLLSSIFWGPHLGGPFCLMLQYESSKASNGSCRQQCSCSVRCTFLSTPMPSPSAACSLRWSASETKSTAAPMGPRASERQLARNVATHYFICTSVFSFTIVHTQHRLLKI